MSATMEMEMQALDLDTGDVLNTDVGIATKSRGEDVRFAYNADRIPHAVVFPELGEGCVR